MTYTDIIIKMLTAFLLRLIPFRISTSLVSPKAFDCLERTVIDQIFKMVTNKISTITVAPDPKV